MKRSLKKLQREKLENKRKGSAVERPDNEEEKKKKGSIVVKVSALLVHQNNK